MSACIEWTGARGVNGYGLCSINGRRVYVHRAAWEVTNGKIPSSYVVHHECENKLCINVQHLRAMPFGEHSTLHNLRDECKAGHPFDTANTYLRSNGRKYCRACGAARSRRNRERAR